MHLCEAVSLSQLRDVEAAIQQFRPSFVRLMLPKFFKKLYLIDCRFSMTLLAPLNLESQLLSVGFVCLDKPYCREVSPA